MHERWLTPLRLPVASSQVGKVLRDIHQAAAWACTQGAKCLEEYLKTYEGQPYARRWNAAEVQRADRSVIP